MTRCHAREVAESVLQSLPMQSFCPQSVMMMQIQAVCGLARKPFGAEALLVERLVVELDRTRKSFGSLPGVTARTRDDSKETSKAKPTLAGKQATCVPVLRVSENVRIESKWILCL